MGEWNYFGAPGRGYLPRFANMELPGQYVKYLVDEKIRENVDALNFDFDRDPVTLSRSRRIYDATSFDLRGFKARRGNILMWHGWADCAMMATSSIGYCEGVMKSWVAASKPKTFSGCFSYRDFITVAVVLGSPSLTP